MRNRHLSGKIASLALSAVLATGLWLPAASADTAADSGAGLSLQQLGTVMSPSTENNEVYISPELDTSSTGVVRVIVELDRQPAAVGRRAALSGARSLSAESTSAAVKTDQSAWMQSARKAGIPAVVRNQFDTVLNGMEIEVPANRIAELANIPGVKAIHANRLYKVDPMFDNASASSAMKEPIDIMPLEDIGVPYAWEQGFTGKGLKIGVIDSGVDYAHPDLQEAYKGGYDSINHDEDPYEDVPIPGVPGSGSSHGTHVAGTIVGRAVNSGSTAQKGIAYEADLYSYKVLGYDEEGGGASGTTAQVVDGLEHAVEDGMDVLNLSLGSAWDKDPNSPEAIAINNAVLSGIVVTVSNGNSADEGSYYYSLGAPATADLAMSVGASSKPLYTYDALMSETVTGSTYEVNTIWTGVGASNLANRLGTQPIEAVYKGLGSASDYSDNEDLTGRIVLVSRGYDGSMNLYDEYEVLADKELEARKHGAQAIVIFNGGLTTDANGNDVPDLTEDQSSYNERYDFVWGEAWKSIPVLDLEGAVGRAIARYAVSNPDVPILLSFGDPFGKRKLLEEEMTTFSSRGPNGERDLAIKPDFAAPGEEIWSTVPAYGRDAAAGSLQSYDDAYEAHSGTSMAAPHVAGLALLLKQAHPDWTPFDIKAALGNTAETLYLDGTQYDVYSQGAGRVNVEAALKTPALLQTVEPITILDKNRNPVEVTNYGSSASFGLMQAGGSAVTKQLQLKNMSGSDVTYTASVLLHPSVTSDPDHPVPTPDVNDITVTMEGTGANGAVTAAAGQAAALSLSLSPNADAADGVYEGEVVLESNGVPALHLPFVVHVGEEKPASSFGIQDIVLSSAVVSPGPDTVQGVNHRMQVTFTLSQPGTNMLELVVLGLDDDLVGQFGSISNRDSRGHLQELQPGTRTVTINPRALTTPDGKTVAIGEGHYRLLIVSYLAGDDGMELFDEDGNPILEYVGLKSFDVRMDAPEWAVVLAGDSFAASSAVTNKTNVNAAVLTLPQATDSVVYSVTNSSNTALIGHDGVLKSVPASGQQQVQLTVRIASRTTPSVYTEQTVDVLLGNAPMGWAGPIGMIGGVNNGAEEPAELTPSMAAVFGQGQREVFVNAETNSSFGVMTATLKDEQLKEAFKGDTPVAVIINAQGKAGEKEELRLTPAQVELLREAAAGSAILFSNGTESVSLTAEALANVPSGAAVAISISHSAGVKEQFEKSVSGATVIGTPVTFEVFYLKDGGKVPVDVPIGQYVKRSFTLDGETDWSSAGVLYAHGGQINPVPAVFTKNEDGTITVTVSRPGFSDYAVVAREVNFTDLGSSWAKEKIESLAGKWLINGVSEAQFAPNAEVTRAQLASMLARALGLQAKKAAPFSDVKSFNWYASDVAAAYEAGLITGYESGEFKPNATISRQDLTVMLARAVKLLRVEPPAGLSDTASYADAGTFAAYVSDSIKLVTDLGFMKGVKQGASNVFQPLAPTTRAAAASVIYDLLRKAEMINE